MTSDHAEERKRLDSPVDADTRVFAIFGDPIGHVRTPVVWSALFRRYGINAVFIPAHVEPDGIDAAIRGMKAMRNVDGLMFTMPHKIAAMRHADSLTERGRRSGSINVMRRNANGTWTGDNVDGAGFVAGLKAAGMRFRGACVHVHGTGGVGRNIAWSVAMEGIARVTLFDVDTDRAERLAREIREESPVRAEVSAAPLADCSLAVNATPLGLEASDPLPFAVAGLASGTIVADVVMDPMITPLLAAARARGLAIHHGRNMMNFSLPLAAAFFGLPTTFDWNGAPLQG